MGVAFTAEGFTIVALTAVARTGIDNEPVYQARAEYTGAS
jgi:hypothetical protein